MQLFRYQEPDGFDFNKRLLYIPGLINKTHKEKGKLNVKLFKIPKTLNKTSNL